MADKSLVLVDGSYYLFRAYHAIQHLSNADGEPTNAIYGVVNMLRKLQADHACDYFAVVFDAKGENFRNELYAEYKANRPPMPEDLAVQIAPLHEIIRAQGLPLLIVDGVEADDVIATLARRARDAGIETLVSTGDKDLAQIVNEDVRLINTMSDTVLDPQGVKKKYGVGPEHIVDYLALVGDTVDNVPGVPKVGPKTAAKWLQEYGSLDEIIAHADEFKGKLGENLRDSAKTLPLSRQLVTLKEDVPLELGPEDLVRRPPETETLREHYRRWNFNSWLKDLDGAPQEAPPGPAAEHGAAGPGGDYETILTRARLDHWIRALGKADLYAVDTETTSLEYINAEIVGLSFAVAGETAAYLPVAHDYPGAPAQLDRDTVLADLKPLLEADDGKKLGHNLKYDMSVLANHGVRLRGIAHDSMLQSYVLDSTASRHDMDSLAERHLGKRTIHYEDIAGKGAKQIPFNQVQVETAAPYAAEDAAITLELHDTFWPRLSADGGLRSLYQDIEIPLVPVLSRMECTGVMIDAGMLKKQSKELLKRMGEIEERAFEVAGQRFNIGSPKQIQAILYERMELPVISKTPKGQPSTAESVLAELAVEHELPRLILDYRALSKLRSTYTDRLPQQVNPRTGRVHTSYHQAVAATGRLSSSDPNLQNIPVRTAEGRRIRQAFIAPQGARLLAADYSQIELRIMAHLSGDESLLEAFAQNKDIHRETAAEVFETPAGEVTGEQRRAAKAINFGLIYGMSPWGLARQLGIERGAAKEYVERYFERYPAVREFMDRTRSEAKDRGYVETVFRRRLYLPDINARNAARRQYAERTAINAPMQGTAADIIKRAMIRIDGLLAERFPEVRMIMQVHDELVFEVPEEQLESLCPEVVSLMCGGADLRVPLAVETGTGLNWDEAH